MNLVFIFSEITNEQNGYYPRDGPRDSYASEYRSQLSEHRKPNKSQSNNYGKHEAVSAYNFDEESQVEKVHDWGVLQLLVVEGGIKRILFIQLAVVSGRKQVSVVKYEDGISEPDGAEAVCDDNNGLSLN